MRYGLFAIFYGSPDQWMPIPTLLSTLCVFAIIFWNKVRVAFSRVWNALRPGTASGAQDVVADDRPKVDEDARR